MPKLIKRDRDNYTNVSNIVVRDRRLSWKARGIFLYLWSQANEWQFYVSEIANHAPDGERSLRTGLKELEDYGYLERTHRHSDTGSFDGMDWILNDSPEETDHHAQNSNDAKKAQNPQKMVENASYAKRTRCETHSMQNRSLRNNNNKNYQYKELTTNKKSSSSSSKEHTEIKDPFAEQQDDDEKIVNGLIGMFLGEAKIAGPAPYEREHIKQQLLKMGRANAIDFMYTMTNKISTSSISNPIAYLERSLINAKGGEANG